jgi:transcriptional regulator with XRE-family HTH domain
MAHAHLMSKRKFIPKKAYKAIGLKVRALRNARNWTLEETEAHGWQSWQHLQTIEAGKNITVQTIINLANLFGVHPSELFKDV